MEVCWKTAGLQAIYCDRRFHQFAFLTFSSSYSIRTLEENAKKINWKKLPKMQLADPRWRNVAVDTMAAKMKATATDSEPERR
jgi:hypothetical protein